MDNICVLNDLGGLWRKGRRRVRESYSRMRRSVVVRASLRSACQFGLSTSKRCQHFRAYTTIHATEAQPSNLHDILGGFNMPKRKDAVGGTLADAKTIFGVKKAKVQVTQDRKMPTVVRKDKLVEDINALSIHEFRSQFVDEDALEYKSDRTDTSSTFNVSLVAADWLAPGEYNAAFRLIEATSRPDYESSTFGWHPRRKRKEMLEPEMKYLLVRRKGAESSTERRKDCGDLDTSILGFLSFMVDYDSSPSVPVLYIYEIHLAETLRGLGLGSHMMHIADLLAQNMGLAKVMLTCFLCNQKAYVFYADHGFLKDACSPEDRKTRNKVVAVDYAILSKDSRAAERTPLKTKELDADAGSD
jgi:ribosomal protein S18 acetylase RimI-like enzyme